MVIVGLVAILALFAITYLPQFLVRSTIARHGKDRPDLPGTGGELARHLLDRFGLEDVAVEISDRGNHYDPDGRAVRLLPAHHDGRSLAAVAIAAHEVGHAIQHGSGDRLLRLLSLVTLPVEFDASFRKALPILEEGGYLAREDMPAARRVLRAAAFTYLAAALVTLIDLARWTRLLR